MRLCKKVQKVGSYFGLLITKTEATELGVNADDRIVNVALVVDSILVWAGKKRLYKFFDRYLIQLPRTKILGRIWKLFYEKDKDIIVIVEKDDSKFMKEISEYVVKTYEIGKTIEKEIEIQKSV